MNPVTLDYRCPRGEDIGHSDLATFALDEAIVERDISRPETNIPNNLQKYGATRSAVRKFFYTHFDTCTRCKDFFVAALPSSRSTIDALLEED